MDRSRLNRELTTYNPGVNWAGSQSGSTPHNQQLEYLVNTSTDNVQKWNIAAAQGSLPTDAGAYTAGQLTKTRTTDEQGRQSISYTDYYGQTILTKVQYTAAVDNGSGSAHAGWLCTYYVYDDYGNLRFVIPSAVVQQIDGTWGISQTLADELCYRFEYDALDRLVIKKNPAAAEVWMVYDVRNRLVMIQDGKMRAGSQWLCHLYDVLNREVLTGTISSGNTLPQMQTAVTAQTGSNSSGTLTGAVPSSLPGNLTLSLPSETGDMQATQSIVLATGFSSQDAGSFIAEIVPQSTTSLNNSVVVNNNPIPNGLTLSPLTALFYDNYKYLSTAGAPVSDLLNAANTQNSNYFITSTYTSPTYAAPITQSNQLQGLATGSMSVALGLSGQNLYAVNIYDDMARIIQTQKVNITGATDIATTQYDFSGKVQRMLLSQTTAGTGAQSHLVSTAMNYDGAGRLQSITKSVTSQIGGTTIATPVTTIETDQYTELAQLRQRTLGNNIESLAYDYNIRGWLLGVNREYAKSSSSNSNYFGYDLGYDKGPIQNAGGQTVGSYSQPAFNGNIAGSLWKSRGDNQQRKYDFSYDAVSRLSGADFNQQTGGVFNKNAGIDFSVTNMGYDANANLSSMKQAGWLLGGSQPIDDLAYHYINNNSYRLQYMEDNSAYNGSVPNSTLGDIHYATAKTTSSNDYGYDPNGNVTSDVNRTISNITYNYLNLPQTITLAKGTIQYVYDASGNKLQKITTESSASVTYNGNTYPSSITTTTSYINGFVYRTVSYGNGALSALAYTNRLLYLGHEDGRVRAIYNNPSTPTTPTAYAFDYYIRDQQDNVRMVLTDEQQQDIYPAATIESSTIATEQTYYSITNDAAHVIPVANLTWWPASYPDNNPPVANPGNPNPNATSAQVYKLNGQTGDKYGLGITLKVMAGDQVVIMAKSAWHNSGTTPSSYPISSVLSNFINAFAGTSAVAAGTHGVVTGTALNSASATTGALTSLLNGTPGQPNPTVAPKAAINWILFNDQFVPVSMGTDLVSSTGDVIKTHNQTIPMTANGYLYVYCSDESNLDVYFDNLQVVNTRGPELEETHYYPAGLVMAGISDRAWNKFGNFDRYQGMELQGQEFYDGSGLEEYDFASRYYDPQIGVWHNQDPARQYSSPYTAMGHSWPNGKDPNGKWFGIDDIIVSAVGFVVGYVTYGITQGNWGGKALLTGLITAAIAEGGYLTLGGGLAETSSLLPSGTGTFSAGLESLVAGGSGSVASATSFAGSIGLSGATSLLDGERTKQLHDASSWGALGLIAGYSLLSSVSAGFSSDYMGGKIDKWLFNGVKPVFKGAFSAGIGGFIESYGDDVLQSYNPQTNKWDVLDITFLEKAAFTGFGGSYASQAVGNYFDKNPNKLSFMDKIVPTSGLRNLAKKSGPGALVSKGMDELWKLLTQ